MKTYIAILLFALTLNCEAMPVEVMSSAPDVAKEAGARIDAITTLQGLISAIDTAQNVEQQIKALKNLSDFQQNPGQAVAQVNASVTGLLNDFNMNTSSSFTTLRGLIAGLSSSTTSVGMNIKLMQASNIQLMTISNTLQQIRAQQQAIIAYKQAEVAEQEEAHRQAKKQDDAFMSDMGRM